jgi:DNA helicase-2/ATP-dependent DNA helicase PcrA
MQDRASTRGMAQPAEARGIVIDAQAVSPYGIGDRVFHQKFGYGEVISVEGDKLDIEFDHAGSKKIVARWVIAAHHVSDVPF